MIDNQTNNNIYNKNNNNDRQKEKNNDRQAKQERFKDRITILIESERILDRITNYPQTDKQIKHKQTKQPLTNRKPSRKTDKIVRMAVSIKTE